MVATVGTTTQINQTTYTGQNSISGGFDVGKDILVSEDLTVTGVTTLNGAVTLGDTSGDTITVNGTVTFNNDVTLGSSAADLMIVTSVIQSNLTPSANASYDLGTSSLGWNNIYLGNDGYLYWSGGNYHLNFNVYSIFPSALDGVFCYIDLGSSSKEFDRIYCDDIYGDLFATTCDLAELQFVDKDCEPGTIVELADWDNGENEIFEKVVTNCKSNKDCDMRFYGYQGRWKKAGLRSTKCPSVVSTNPGSRLGSDPTRLDLYNKNQMKYVALSGSIPNVFVVGEFKSGDILVSSGEGKAMVDNNAPWNQAIGYCKRSGSNERCEIWVR